MYKYKVFRQIYDHSFLEIAQTVLLEDAEAVYARQDFGLISEVGGVIIQTKLMEHDQLTLI